MVPWDICVACTVHAGFYNSWTSAKSLVEAAIASARQTYPSYAIVSTGHSLGGAIATIAAADLRATSGYDVSLVRQTPPPIFV
jgi:alpha-beta hydrolase superfamily lysophospholipase